jgi:hypothetical protein
LKIPLLLHRRVLKNFRLKGVKQTENFNFKRLKYKKPRICGADFTKEF